MFEHSWPIRVYYADTDAIGIVYHANYLKFFELARTESLRSIGIELPVLLVEYGVQFAVMRLAVTYHKPARLDDKLLVVSQVLKLGLASVTYAQYIYLNDRNGLLLCEAQVKLVTVDKQMRPTAVPSVIKQEIEAR